ncbi:hypothetical protein CGLO_13340 [Colletotrichum gloeosporioides Cg-14]|uniref:Uncharacterized protein n=1 Tax=Colletotrichum gloeosporioides (strain Cg-14) TaxID=1237896 RepID=T0L7C3_COLGC|nr:hypothetical protein CGLO_13340 [Colletotrichum gloeosporioides Cg-14]
MSRRRVRAPQISVLGNNHVSHNHDDPPIGILKTVDDLKKTQNPTEKKGTLAHRGRSPHEHAEGISQDLTICEGTRYAILVRVLPVPSSFSMLYWASVNMSIQKSEPNLGGDFIQNDVARVLIGKKLIYLVQA